VQIIMRGLRASCDLAVAKLREISVGTDGSGPESREVLEKCAGTALNSKLISQHKVRRL
jgi:T-complex protein 1 subunit eta